jgi:transcriptional regulator with XRE-family HTH domain
VTVAAAPTITHLGVSRSLAPMTTAAARMPVGGLLRDWRVRRRRSQLDLSIDVGVSTRHLSFVETGRSKPSPELVLAIAEQLDVPLRERNTLLLAAGFAPRYTESSIDDPALAMAKASVQQMLNAHDPYPGVVIDRQWNIVLANQAAATLTAGLPPFLAEPPLNVFRVCLHPEGLAAVTLNFDDWARYLLRQLRRAIMLTADPALVALDEEVRSYPNVIAVPGSPRISEWDDPPLLVPVRLRLGGHEVSLFTTLTMFGTPRDITLDELAVELFFPADDASDAVLRGGAISAP